MDSMVAENGAETGTGVAHKDDVSIDFSNINDAASASTASASPSAKPMIPVRKENMGKFYVSAPYTKIQHPADKSLLAAFLAGIIFLLFSLIIMCPTWAIVLAVLPFGFVIKKCLSSCCCCCACRTNKAPSHFCSEKLNQSEILWLHDSQFNKMVVQCLITLERGLDIAKIKELIGTRLVMPESKTGKKLHPRFTQKLVSLYSGYAWMNDENFSLDKHVLTMPNTIHTQAHLENHISQLASQSMAKDKPLWEVHLLPNFGGDKDMVMLFRFHPIICDGVTSVRILLSSLADGHSILGLKPRFGRSAYLFNMFRSFVIGPLVFFQKWIFTRKDVNVIHGRNVSGSKTVVWSEPYSYGTAYRIKQVTRTTLNDVFISAVAGCLRKYMQVNGVQHPFDSIANLVVDLRSNNTKIKMGVVNTLLPIILPTNIEGAVPRLWQVRHLMEDLKNSVDTAVMHGGLWILLHMLPECLALRIFHCIHNKASCLLSSLQGPDVVLTMGSCEIRSMVYWAPARHSCALSISFLTYADQVRMAVIADKDIIPDPSILTKEFHFQMQQLSQLLAHRRIPGEHHSRRSLDLPSEDRDSEPSEPSLEELQHKMAEVQVQLQDLKARLDEETEERFSEDEESLVGRVEELREEFRELLIEMRRKRSTTGSSILSDDEDDADGEIRRPYRRRTFSGTSRRSVLSTMSSSRPLATPSTQSQHNMSPQTPPSDVAPSSPSFTVSACRKTRYHTVHLPPARRKSLDPLHFLQQGSVGSAMTVSKWAAPAADREQSASVPSVILNMHQATKHMLLETAQIVSWVSMPKNGPEIVPPPHDEAPPTDNWEAQRVIKMTPLVIENNIQPSSSLMEKRANVHPSVLKGPELVPPEMQWAQLQVEYNGKGSDIQPSVLREPELVRPTMQKVHQSLEEEESSFDNVTISCNRLNASELLQSPRSPWKSDHKWTELGIQNGPELLCPNHANHTDTHDQFCTDHTEEDPCKHGQFATRDRTPEIVPQFYVDKLETMPVVVKRKSGLIEAPKEGPELFPPHCSH